MYEKTYTKSKENPGGSPKDPLINRPSAFSGKGASVPIITAKKETPAEKPKATTGPPRACRPPTIPSHSSAKKRE